MRIFPHIAHTFSTPGRARQVLVRRLLAALLVGAAGVSALRTSAAHPAVPVFAHDVPAGHILEEGDVSSARFPRGVIPAAALAQTPVGSVVVAAANAGEIITTARLLDPELTAGDLPCAGQGLSLVPLTLAKPDIVTLLHHGDEVSIIAAADIRADSATSRPNEASETSEAIATGGRVVITALPTGRGGASGPGTILIALPPAAAQAVAAASLVRPLTVIVTGPRAHK